MREMLYGTRDEFNYFQCSRCGCLQISEIPANIERYYPTDYYSFCADPARKYGNPVIRWLRNIQDRSTIVNNGPFARLVRSFAPNRRLLSLSSLGLSRDSRIIDVGCGSGWLLYALKECGFNNLLGVDPFLGADITYTNGLSIRKTAVRDLSGTWDLIMYHHSFEHITDPFAELAAASRILKHDGTCLIRIPIVSSYAWERYQENWVAVDAPRHYFLHSLDSIALLAQRTGFSISDIIYDSTEYQFRASELYARGIPQYPADPGSVIMPNFPKEQIRQWKRRAAELNREHRGDQAAFLLKKSNDERA